MNESADTNCADVGMRLSKNWVPGFVNNITVVRKRYIFSHLFPIQNKLELFVANREILPINIYSTIQKKSIETDADDH